MKDKRVTAVCPNCGATVSNCKPDDLGLCPAETKLGDSCDTPLVLLTRGRNQS